MGFVEDMKWWHWIVVSLLVGAALGYINSATDPTPSNNHIGDVVEFEQYLLRTPAKDAADPTKIYPWIQNVTVYPPKTSATDGTITQLVTYYLLEPVNDGYQPTEYALIAPYPYEPHGPRATGRGGRGNLEPYPEMKIYVGKQGDTLDSVMISQYGKHTREGRIAIVDCNGSLANATSAAQQVIVPGASYYIPPNPADKKDIVDFLKAAKAITTAPNQASWISFKYAKWHEPKASYEIWMTGSLVVVGILWPMTIQLMLTGGLGRKKETGDYDLSRFKGGKEPQVAAVQQGMTAEDEARLKDLEEQMAASLKARQDAEPAAAPVVVGAGEPVKQLKSGKDAEEHMVEQTDEEKAYTGEFYPVVKQVTHKDDKKNPKKK